MVTRHAMRPWCNYKCDGGNGAAQFFTSGPEHGNRQAIGMGVVADRGWCGRSGNGGDETATAIGRPRERCLPVPCPPGC